MFCSTWSRSILPVHTSLPCLDTMATTSRPLSPEELRAEVDRKRAHLRQGILPPTDPQGRHSQPDPSHELARAILAVSHDGLLQDFQSWLNAHRTRFPNIPENLDNALKLYFGLQHPRPTSSSSCPTCSTSPNQALKVQCQYCKKMFSGHCTLPMCPQALELCESNTYIFCRACLQATPTNNHMIHPGPWLNTTDECQRAGMQPILDLTVAANRHWSLQSLDADDDKDFAPFVWILAVPSEAQSAREGVIQHFWNHSLSRWRRLPLSHINTKGSFTNYDIDEFQKLTGDFEDSQLHLTPCHRQLFPPSRRTTPTAPHHVHQLGGAPHPSRPQVRPSQRQETWCSYQYGIEGVTEVLTPKQVTKLMALTYCRMMISSYTKGRIKPAKRKQMSTTDTTA